MNKHGFHRHRHHLAYFLVLLVGGLALFSLGVMLLWNWLMPTLFLVQPISFLQALGLLVLSRLLFGGLGHMHGLMHLGHGGMFRSRMRERWEQMSQEEREKFHERFHERFHGGPRGRGHGCCHHGPEHRGHHPDTAPSETPENHD